MKFSVLVLTAILLASCGQEESVSVINGKDGNVGAVGPAGVSGSAGSSGASVTAYSASSCTNIPGTSYYVKNNGSNMAVYLNSNSCHSNAKVTEIGDDDSFWFATNKLGVAVYGGGIRVITFNL